MCINWYTSLATFTVGTVVNAMIWHETDNVNYRMMVIVWQFVLFMQALDFLAWIDPKCGKLNQLVTKVAYLQNVLQPIVLGLVLLIGTQVKELKPKIYAALSIIFYICVTLYTLYFSDSPFAKASKPQACLAPTKTCQHLDYTWWHMLERSAIFVYLVPVVTCILLLLKPTTFARYNVMYVIVSYLASWLFYGCGNPTVFCLFAVGAPIMNYILLRHG